MNNILEDIELNSVDSIVTDPPYELNFMGKSWDNQGVAFRKETWKKCFDVLKPGGYLLAFGGSRTFHRIACAIEDAGFEIRDTIMWLYGSGFPKSMNIANAVEAKLTTGSANTKEFKNLDGDKIASGGWGINKMKYEQGDRPNNYDLDSHLINSNVHYKTNEGKKWKGWGTCLKPAFEPVIVARKPFSGSLVDNILEYGVGGLNIDGCRVPFEDTPNPATNPLYRLNAGYKTTSDLGAGDSIVGFGTSKNETSQLGRFPANVMLTYDETDEEEVCSGFPNTVYNGGSGEKSVASGLSGKVYMGGWSHDKAGEHLGGLGDSGSAARYFYCAKASKKDRDEGLDGFREQRKAGFGYDRGYMNAGEGMFKERKTLKRNIHPTVKPTELMQYLVRLVTPDGGTVLDPFNGSGSTGKAVMFENKEKNKGYKYIGVELDENYLKISKARIDYARGTQVMDWSFKPTEKKEETKNGKYQSLW